MARPAKSDAPEFGKRLAQARQAAGMTQARLAAKLGLSVKTIDHYERRCESPTIKFVKRVAPLLGTTPVKLLEDEGAKRPGPASKLETQLELIRKLPPKEKKAIGVILDMALRNVAASSR